jgi:hypothetical protein
VDSEDGTSLRNINYGQVYDKLKAPESRALGRLLHLLSRKDGVSQRYSSWNFTYVVKDCGTVEFRRPPGCAKASDAAHWIGFAMSFVQGALLADNGTFEPFAARRVIHGLTVTEMVKNFLRPGAVASDVERYIQIPLENMQNTPMATISQSNAAALQNRQPKPTSAYAEKLSK